MHLSRALTAKLAACILAVTAVITPSFAASVGTVVSDSGLNVRAEASAESQVFTTLSSGTQVDVLSTTGDRGADRRRWRLVPDRGRLCQQRLCGPGGCGGGLCFRQGQ